MDARIYYVLLSMIDGLGPIMINRLTGIFGSAENVWRAGEKELLSIPGMPPGVMTGFLTKRKSLHPESEWQRLQRGGIEFISVEDPEYPPYLKHIYDPPSVLYVRGNINTLQLPMFAVVGSRKATYYGLGVAEKIARELVAAGLCIVSGMARGIDTAGHRGALSAGGPTVAVLGCGVDVVYPRENKKIMSEIIHNGAVLSEFPPGTEPIAGNFPRRNRVISGLSRGVLVIEAAERSGSLITADFALEQGRDVFAVPGQVTNPINRGAHRLIKQGARLVEDVADILEDLGLSPVGKEGPGKENLPHLTNGEKKVYNIISDTPVSSDHIIAKTGISAAEVMSLLLLMEMKGLVKQLPGHRYVKGI